MIKIMSLQEKKLVPTLGKRNQMTQLNDNPEKAKINQSKTINRIFFLKSSLESESKILNLEKKLALEDGQNLNESSRRGEKKI